MSGMPWYVIAAFLAISLFVLFFCGIDRCGVCRRRIRKNEIAYGATYRTICKTCYAIPSFYPRKA